MRLVRGLSPASDAFFLPKRMYICYLDESGTVEQSGNTDHFVLLGLAVRADSWRAKDGQVSAIKAKYSLGDAEIHTAWMARDYVEQRSIPNFAALDRVSRRRAVLGVRSLNLGRTSARQRTRELLKNYRKTEAYVHLTHDERLQCLDELATLIGSWSDIRLFSDAHAKKHANGVDHFSFAFEQVVTRFNTFLRNTGGGTLGLLVQDNNETESKRLTAAMRKYHRTGTLFARIDKIVETPMFVDSSLTSMIQLADICAYATRRFFDKGETRIFDKIRPRFDRYRTSLVGLRHFTARYQCRCDVCIEHGRSL